jgi:hypothetical protein
MRALIVGILILLPWHAVAQQPKTLMDANIEHGGFGGPMFGITALADEAALLVGGGGAWLIDRTFFIGGAGLGLTTNVPEPRPMMDVAARELNFGYGGLLLGYVHASDHLIHWKVQSLLGAGGVGFRDLGVTDPEPFFVVEPAAFAEVNATYFFRVAAGLSYRYIVGVDMPGITADDLTGPSLMVLFKFGSF